MYLWAWTPIVVNLFERVSIDALKTTYELMIGLENGARFFT